LAAKRRGRGGKGTYRYARKAPRENELGPHACRTEKEKRRALFPAEKRKKSSLRPCHLKGVLKGRIRKGGPLPARSRKRGEEKRYLCIIARISRKRRREEDIPRAAEKNPQQQIDEEALPPLGLGKRGGEGVPRADGQRSSVRHRKRRIHARIARGKNIG